MSTKAAKSVDSSRHFATKPAVVKVHNANGSAAKRAGLARNVAKIRRSDYDRHPKRDADPTHKRANRTPGGLPAIKGALLPATPSTYVGRLSTVFDWHRQVGKVYREMRRHQIDPSLGTKLTYVANVGATLARFIEEMAPIRTNVPPDLSRLNDVELAQLEQLLTKAAGHQAQERIAQSIAGAADDD